MHDTLNPRHAGRTKQRPTWDIALLFPAQGCWSEEDYFALQGNRLIEFSHGVLEVLPMPTTSHQMLVAFFYGMLLSHVSRHDLGSVLFAPLHVRLWEGKYREPDVIFMKKEHASRIGEEFWQGADPALEVVSGDEADRKRDLAQSDESMPRQALANTGSLIRRKNASSYSACRASVMSSMGSSSREPGRHRTCFRGLM
jgi:hypothetical protein